MRWRNLELEIAMEMRGHASTMWDAWAMWTPTRDEAARQADAKAETSRRIAVLHAVGKTREARKLESYQRAARKRAADRKAKAKGKSNG
jgi:hypothetical protein